MKKKFCIFAAVVLTAIIFMIAEYRFIMVNLRPYRGENGTVYIEFMGQVDEYYAEKITKDE